MAIFWHFYASHCLREMPGMLRDKQCMQGVLDAKGRNSLSKCIFYCFIPSLTFTKLAASVDLTNMGRWWFLPVNVLLRCAHQHSPSKTLFTP